MKTTDYFELIINKLLDKNNQTFTTILVCGLLLSLLLTPLLVISSLENNVLGLLKLVEVNNVYVVSQNSSGFSDSKLNFFNITIENAKAILPVLIIKGHYLENEIIIKGVTLDYIKLKNIYNIEENKFKNEEGIFVGNLFAKLFNISKGEILEIKINNDLHKFKVISIHYSNSEDDFALLINLNLLWSKKIYENKVSYYEILLKGNINGLVKKLEEKLGQRVKIIYNDNSKAIETIAEEPIKIILAWINLVYLISFLAGFTFTLSNTKNFKHDIEILTALGINHKDKIVLILSTSFIVAFLGTLVGIVLSFVITSSMLSFISGISNMKIEFKIDEMKILNLSLIYFTLLFLGYFVGLIFISKKTHRLR